MVFQAGAWPLGPGLRTGVFYALDGVGFHPPNW